MAEKVKIAVNWAGACGGCDVSILDIEGKLLDLAAVADVVYWPVAMDFKRKDLESYGRGEIDVGVFNGCIRTSEHEEDAKMLRERCRVLVAFGACAAFGGIPGLGNLFSAAEILDRVYSETPSTENPEKLRPLTATPINGHSLQLPEFRESVKALPSVVEVDYIVPGCPPTMERVLDVVHAIIGFAQDGVLPPKGTVFASDKALCDSCDRVQTRTGARMSQIRRPHELIADPNVCFLEQGIICLGIATRGGCGGPCIKVNMPCRGCFGPTAAMLDPAAEALSAIGSIASRDHEDDIPANERLAPIRAIVDVAGTFYRFTLPAAAIPGTLKHVSKG
ncbi:MAG: oxidoreductase [Acidobacteriota bacterium]